MHSLIFVLVLFLFSAPKNNGFCMIVTSCNARFGVNDTEHSIRSHKYSSDIKPFILMKHIVSHCATLSFSAMRCKTKKNGRKVQSERQHKYVFVKVKTLLDAIDVLSPMVYSIVLHIEQEESERKKKV